MAGTIQNQSSQAIAPLIDRIFNIGQLSRLEHLQLVSTILSDYKVTDEERSQINRVFDELQIGRLKLVS
ncbi:MAG TPA: hypothetical protein DD379_19165 [Cyanobacteria bacterium UBA11162]|nr:hypothetical protein [Cyanobacteria bacterium UBA11162]